MTSLVFYFQVHQPHRLKRYRFFDIGREEGYFDDEENRRILERVAQKCYLPMNALLLRQIEQHEGRFRCSFSVSGTALEQMERWSPETLESFQRLAATGCVEFLAETSHHSLSALGDEEEFREQVRAQAARVEDLFGQRPRVFRNTELVLSNRVAQLAEELGFEGILGEGADHLLGWRSPHRVYRPEGTRALKLLLRSYRLSDDIAFRFSNREWAAWPLTADRFAHWVHDLPTEDRFVGLFMDYETFGEHQWADTGIFDFMEALPGEVLRHERFGFQTPSEVVASSDSTARLDIPSPVSWADAERDLTAWLDNAMQRGAHEAVYSLSARAREAARRGHPEVLETWRKLSTSDHFYYMCVKFFSDGDVHKYFSPYATPHDAYIALANVLADFGARLEALELPAIEVARSDALLPSPPVRFLEEGDAPRLPEPEPVQLEPAPARVAPARPRRRRRSLPARPALDHMALLCTLHADGPRTLRILREAGCETLEQLAELQAEQAAELLGAAPGEARRLVREARRLVGQSAPPLEHEEVAYPPATQAATPAVPAAAPAPFEERSLAEPEEPADSPAPLGAPGEASPLEIEGLHELEVRSGRIVELEDPEPVSSDLEGLPGLDERCTEALLEAGIASIDALLGASVDELEARTGLGFTKLRTLQFLAARRREEQQTTLIPQAPPAGPAASAPNGAPSAVHPTTTDPSPSLGAAGPFA